MFFWGRRNAVDILGVGAQKSATSWAAYALNLHENVWIPKDKAHSGKEVMFWDKHYERGLDWYKQTMTPPNPRMKSMDVSPGYTLVNAERIAECRKQSPGARVFLLLRNPIYRDWSSLLMEASLRHNFDVKGAGTDDILEFYERLDIGRYSTYLKTLLDWRAAYGEKLFVGLYDDIVDDPESFYVQLCRHCRVDPDSAKDWRRRVTTKIFKGPDIALPAEVHAFLRDKYAEMVMALQDELRRDLSDWLSGSPRIR